jgi:hypothetical protein
MPALLSDQIEEALGQRGDERDLDHQPLVTKRLLQAS